MKIKKHELELEQHAIEQFDNVLEFKAEKILHPNANHESIVKAYDVYCKEIFSGDAEAVVLTVPVLGFIIRSSDD